MFSWDLPWIDHVARNHPRYHLIHALSTQQSCRARVAGEATSQLIGTLVLRLFAEFVLCADHLPLWRRPPTGPAMLCND